MEIEIKIAKLCHKYVLIIETVVLGYLLYLFCRAFVFGLENPILMVIINVLLLILILFSLYIDELETLLEERENK